MILQRDNFTAMSLDSDELAFAWLEAQLRHKAFKSAHYVLHQLTELAIRQWLGQLNHDHVDLRLRPIFEVKITESGVVQFIFEINVLYAAVLRTSE